MSLHQENIFMSSETISVGATTTTPPSISATITSENQWKVSWKRFFPLRDDFLQCAPQITVYESPLYFPHTCRTKSHCLRMDIGQASWSVIGYWERLTSCRIPSDPVPVWQTRPDRSMLRRPICSGSPGPAASPRPHRCAALASEMDSNWGYSSPRLTAGRAAW